MQLQPAKVIAFTKDIEKHLDAQQYDKIKPLIKSFKDGIEIVHTPHCAEFLQHAIPCFILILEKTSCVFEESDPQQQIRNNVLEVIQRLPPNEHLEQYAKPLMAQIIDVLQNDNEINAVQAVKIIMELYKAFRLHLEEYAQPFLQFVDTLYANFKLIVQDTLKNPTTEKAKGTRASTRRGQKKVETQLRKSTLSCKVLTECPLLVVIVLQAYKKFTEHFLQEILRKQMESFDVPIELPAESTKAEDPDLSERYSQLIASQVKTASFFVYSLRAYPHFIVQYHQKIPQIVTDLLLRCPSDAFSSRKELLVIMRHMMDAQGPQTAQEQKAVIRDHFVPHISNLLDDKALLGSYQAYYASARPLAYSTLADLIHHVRSKLNLQQIDKTITFYTRIMYDPTLTLSIQTMSAKLLAHLVESIYHICRDPSSPQERELGVEILINILRAYTTKTKTLSRHIKKVQEVIEELKKKKGAVVASGSAGENNAKDDETESSDESSSNEMKKSPSKKKSKPASESTTTTTTTTASDSSDTKSDEQNEETKEAKDMHVYYPLLHKNESLEENLNQCRLMLKTLVLGLKNVAYVLINMDEVGIKANAHRDEEIRLLVSLFKHGVNCFPVYQLIGSTLSDEEKENMKTFASLFTILSPPTFEEVFNQQMQFLYDKIVENEAYLDIVNYFCANTRLSPHFSLLLLQFLVENMDKLGEDNKESVVLLKCFKIIFGFIFSFKEKMTVPLLKKIVFKCLYTTNEKTNSLNYYRVLRFLFRSLALGKYDDMIKEFIPMVTMIVERLHDLTKTAFKSPTRELFVELCLTVPAKLHVLCPYLPFLVRPALYALQGPDLIGITFRNVELWVKSLRRESIEVLFKPVMPEIIHALFSHLKPAPYRYGEVAMKILATLGGNNRKFLSNPTVTAHMNDFKDGLNLSIRFNMGALPSRSHDLSLDSFVKLARRVLHLQGTSRQKKTKLAAFQFLQNCFVSQLDLSGESLEEHFKFSPELFNQPLAEEHLNYAKNNFVPFGISDEKHSFLQSHHKSRLGTMIFRRLLSTILASVADDQLKEESEPFVRQICRHFVLVFLSKSHIRPDATGHSSPDLFLDSLVDVFCFESSAAQFAFKEVVVSMRLMCHGDEQLMTSFGIWNKFKTRICHCCYQAFKKTGGCKGIVSLFENLPKHWLKENELDFARALLFIVKDVMDQPSQAISQAEDALMLIFKSCHDDFLEAINNSTSVEDVLKNAEEDADQTPDARRFVLWLKLIVPELASSHPTVRTTVQDLLTYATKTSEKSVKEIISVNIPDLEKMFATDYFNKQSRKGKTGIIECLAYLLACKPQVISITQDVKSIVKFANDYAGSKHEGALSDEDRQIYKKLRIGCLRLLTRYVNCAEVQEMKEKEDVEARTQIVGIFFKYLELSDYVDIAKEGLKEYISQAKLSRHLLSQSLKPVLQNVSKHTNLTSPVLRTLSHLLELCTSYFSPKLGDQLVHNLEHWKQPSTITHIPGEETRIAAKIMDLFPLLPPESRKSLPELAQLTLDLEQAWKGQCSEFSSPFRKPLAKFLNLYPEETLQYFLEEKLSSDPDHNYPHFRLFVSILKMPEAPRVHEELKHHADIIIEKTFKAATAVEQSQDNATTKKMNHKRSKGITLVYQLTKMFPDWLVTQDALKEHLLDGWNTIINTNKFSPGELRTDHEVSHKIHMIAHCFINYCRHDHTETGLLFKLLEVFSYPLVSDYTFLRDFFKEEIPKYSKELQRKILEKCIDLFEDEEISSIVKVEALNYLFGTIIQHNFVPAEKEDAADIVPDALMKRVFSTLFNAKTMVEDEALTYQILQLAITFVRHLTAHMIEYRKEMMKMAYNRISRENAGKQHAFVLAAYFIEKFETPEKIIVQVYVSLLRYHQAEGKPQVKKALDILAKELPRKIPATDGGTPKYITWTKKVWLDEGHSLQQLMHLWYLFVKHPDIFYVSREFFIPKIVNSLGKIGSSNSQLDQKKLAIDLADLIVSWESRYVRELETSARDDESTNGEAASTEEEKPEEVKDEDKMEIEASGEGSKKRKRPEEKSSADQPSKKKKLKMPFSEQQEGVAERIISFLIKVTLYIHQSRTDPNQLEKLTKKTLNVLENALELWDYGKIKNDYIHKMLSDSSTNVPMVVSVLKILEIILKHRKEFIVREAKVIFKDIAKYFQESDPKLIGALISFIGEVFEVFPLTKTSKPPDELRDFYTFLLRLGASCFNGDTKQVYGHLALLQLVCTHFPHYTSKFTDSVHRTLIKMLNEHAKFTKESVKQAQANVNTRGQRQSQARKLICSVSAKNHLYVEPILICIDFLSFGGHEGAKLKHYFQTVASIIDKNLEINPRIVQKVLENLKSWLLSENPDAKRRRVDLSDNQKAFFVNSITSLEISPPVIRKQCYNLLLALYQDEGIHRKKNSFTECVEANFMIGLRNENASSRKKFLDALNSRIGPTIFERMLFVFDSKNWIPLKDTFWVRHALDIIIDSVLVDDAAEIDNSSCKIPSITGNDDNADLSQYDESIYTEEERKHLHKSITPPNENDDMKDDIQKLLKDHEGFLAQHRSMNVKDLLVPLRQLGRESVRLSYDLWVALFESAWSTLTQLQRDDLYESLISLLSRDYHSKQYIKYPNVIQALLEGISKCKPSIKFSPEMLRFLGKSFNAWHIVIPMMEQELELMYSRADYGDRCERFSACLAELYNVLMEHDMLCGIWRNFDISTFTRHALALEKYGMLEETQDVLEQLIQGFSTGEMTRSDVSHFELSLWEDQWLATAKRLQQWDKLDEYSNSTPNTSLQLQCLWMRGEWGKIRDIFERYSINKSQLFNICQISAAIMTDQEKKDEYYHHATQLALQRWCALPTFICHTHLDMLHSFQQLLELHESGVLMDKVDKEPKYHLKELQAFMMNWRDRVPNKWDDIDMWRDILYWRNHFMTCLPKKFDPTTASPQHKVCVNESVSILNTFANVSRKHNVIVPALKALRESEQLIQTHLSQLDTREYGTRYYELLKCFESQEFYDNVIHAIDSEVTFKKLRLPRKLDLLRVRAGVLNKLGNRQAAIDVYSSSVYLFPKSVINSAVPCDALGRTFLEWSELLDDIHEASPSTENCINVIVGYMEAVRFGCKQAIPYLSRVLWLMSHKEDEKKVFEAVKRCIQDIPAHVWLPFIQQLNSMLQRDMYGDLAKGIFGRVTKEYIQAVFYIFRSMCFHIRKPYEESLKDKESDDHKVLARVKKHHDDLIQFCAKFPVFHQIQASFNEVSVRLSPTLDEELGQCFHHLLNDCYSQNIFSDAKVPSHAYKMVKETLKILYHQHMNIQFLIENRDTMKDDLMDKDLSIFEFTQRLRKWHNLIQKRINLNPTTLPLEHLCPSLNHCDVHHVEVPGQYNDLAYGEKPFIEQHDKILCFSPDVDVIRRYLVDCRRICIRSHTGRPYNFLVQNTPSGTPRSFARSEEKAYSVLNHFNSLLSSNIQAHSKYLQFHTPTIIPLSHVSRLVLERSFYSSLEDVYFEHCVEKNQNMDDQVIAFWKRYNETGNRLDAFLEVKNATPDHLLLDYMNLLCSTWNDFFTIRQRFVKQTALYSIANHLFNVQDCSTHKLMIGRLSGEIYQFDFRTFIHKDGTLTEPQSAPFRLTQNVQKFIGGICTEGVLLNSMSIAARALFLKQRHVRNLLNLYLRDEISSWVSASCGTVNKEYMIDENKADERAKEQAGELHKRLTALDMIHDDGSNVTDADEQNEEWKPVNYEIERLIHAACSDKNLSDLSPSTFPFF
uniref:Non-specific serine/threonine protein kinase n=1 Tax=Percolomonas cosmopolitus TaxID=63605 RepID=A0A6U0LAK3_9EUKA|mmetsp:Transcript_5797/g.21911  ORF Transcript_5797/g.21911 Transcript_5797/m.21911 type:complete len:3755 (+) Transcript_5797:543-11807(+)|eukprot:CAMPEP_0117450484 /NCGR_PEP_ID=MMETSP0759-20121206/8491_1 /TAXON_ID=63605 /ORGANISM="Percolomonas cosmopolitus, Strain WS" /LENGTH=3754 /DNA_ID=CAMNT_0005243005 /DNA_START=236 /DNA_END=11500 /DNA_ORIENTATION=-